MKIVQIATAVEHYKNGEVYTDLYGIDEEGNPHIFVNSDWNLLTISRGDEEFRGGEKPKRKKPIELSFDNEIYKEIFGNVTPSLSQIKSLEKLCRANYEYGKTN